MPDNSNSYATRNEVKAALRIGTADTADDVLIDNCRGAASRLIDGYCNRQFWAYSTVEARVFQANTEYVCDVDDFYTTTGFILKTSTFADGNFDITWAATDVQLEPLNAVLDGLNWSYNKLRAIGDYLFPTVNANYGEQALVQVTAKWGWTAVPDPVIQATIIQASRIFKRYDSPLGVAGFGDLGAIRVSRFLDPDMAQLVEPYRRMRMFA
jgi:hypothetical protein